MSSQGRPAGSTKDWRTDVDVNIIFIADALCALNPGLARERAIKLSIILHLCRDADLEPLRLPKRLKRKWENGWQLASYEKRPNLRADVRRVQAKEARLQDNIDFQLWRVRTLMKVLLEVAGA